MLCGSYIITHLPTAASYVGQSVDITRIWTDHVRLLAHGKHPNTRLQELWGEPEGPTQFAFTIVDTYLPADLPITIDLLAGEAIRSGRCINHSQGALVCLPDVWRTTPGLAEIYDDIRRVERNMKGPLADGRRSLRQAQRDARREARWASNAAQPVDLAAQAAAQAAKEERRLDRQRAHEKRDRRREERIAEVERRRAEARAMREGIVTPPSNGAPSVGQTMADRLAAMVAKATGSTPKED